jgi:hypothetical protein
MFVPVPLIGLVVGFYLGPVMEYVGMRHALWRRQKVIEFIATTNALDRIRKLRNVLRVVARDDIGD